MSATSGIASVRAICTADHDCEELFSKPGTMGVVVVYAGAFFASEVEGSSVTGTGP
jgi:hypothetical protein